MSGSGSWTSPQLSVVGQGGWGEPVPEASHHRGLFSLGEHVLPASPAPHPGQPTSAGGAGGCRLPFSRYISLESHPHALVGG